MEIRVDYSVQGEILEIITIGNLPRTLSLLLGSFRSAILNATLYILWSLLSYTVFPSRTYYYVHYESLWIWRRKLSKKVNIRKLT